MKPIIPSIFHHSLHSYYVISVYFTLFTTYKTFIETGLSGLALLQHIPYLSRKVANKVETAPYYLPKQLRTDDYIEMHWSLDLFRIFSMK